MIVARTSCFSGPATRITASWSISLSPREPAAELCRSAPQEWVMGERLYILRHDQGYFETGLAHGKQVLPGNTVHEIVAHWFDMAGQFIGLERFRMAIDPPSLPGTTLNRTEREYQRAVDAEMAAVKQRLGFQPADIRVQAFESEEATIADLPGEYQQFLESPGRPPPKNGSIFQERLRSGERRAGSFLIGMWITGSMPMAKSSAMVEAGAPNRLMASPT